MSSLEKVQQKITFLPGFMGESHEGDFLKEIFSDIKSINLFSFPHQSSLSQLFEQIKEDQIFYGYSLGGRLLLHLVKYFQLRPKLLILESSGPPLKGEKAKSKIQLDLERGKKIHHHFDHFINEWYQQDLWGRISLQERQSLISSKLSFSRDQQILFSKQIVEFSPANLDGFNPWEDTITFPILYFWGEQDLKYRSLGQNLPSHPMLTALEIKNVGHNIHRFSPQEILSALIKRVSLIS